MKRAIAFTICLLAGIGIGWFFGYTRPVAENQRRLLVADQYFREHTRKFDADVEAFNKLRAEYSKIAEPWQKSTAGISLAALKSLKTNDTEDAKLKLAGIIAVYYRGHSRDGDTNLLAGIAAFAATDAAFSNAIYGSLSSGR